MSKLIEDLMNPSAYPENPNKIKFVQTHISTVFIGDKFVYKIKKPVNFGFLDFSTLDKRLFYCKQEVELNNRFSKGVYLGVFPVNFNGERHVIDGDGIGADQRASRQNPQLPTAEDRSPRLGFLAAQGIQGMGRNAQSQKINGDDGQNSCPSDGWNDYGSDGRVGQHH